MVLFQQNAAGQKAVGMPFIFTNAGAPVLPASTTLLLPTAAADNSTFILSPTGFNFNFADVTYPYIVVSTNGWAALVPSSELTFNSIAVLSAGTLSNTNTLTVPSTAGITAGMYVSGPNIMGAGTASSLGMARVLAVTSSTTFTININAPAGGLTSGSTVNFYTPSTTFNNAFVNALPANNLSSYSGGFPLIAPMWDDMAMTAIIYTAGTSTSLKWLGKWDKTNISGSFQFGTMLNSTNGNITLIYPSLSYSPTSASASIGIAGRCAGDFYSMTPLTLLTASVDSVTENNTITGAMRPNNIQYTFSPYCPNDACSGTRPATDLGTANNTCNFKTYSIANATSSGSAICSTTDTRDVWFKFIKPASASTITVTTAPTGLCGSATGTTVEIFTACGGTSLGCAKTSTSNPNFGVLSVSRLCVAEILYARVTCDNDINASGTFQLCVTANDVPAGGAVCSAPSYICSLPFTHTGLTTAGSVNNYDSTTAVCHTASMKGEDFVFSYTPATNECIRISITSADQNPGVFIFNNCPDSTGGTTYCLGSSEVVTGTATINSVSLTAGVTYYIVVDNNTSAGNSSINFDISVTTVGTANSYDDCATPADLGPINDGVNCTFSSYSTECSTPSAIGSVAIPSCINSTIPPTFVNGVTGDVWLKFTAAFTGSILINTQHSLVNPTSNLSMAIYMGSCGAFTLLACNDNAAPGGMPGISLWISSGTTYYIRLWSESPASQGNFDICINSNCDPANDLPCNAFLIPMGNTLSGSNDCANSISEPTNAAQCTSGGTGNTVWYKAVVPASGKLHIRTIPLTLTDTQIQAFLFPTGCSNAQSNFISKGCNDDGTACSGGFSDFSDLNVSGLTPGDTLFIAVDGLGQLTGTFEITVIDGNNTSFAPIQDQDCEGAREICTNSTLLVSNPGYRNFGNICDLPTGTNTCWGGGERNSNWYRFSVDPSLSGGTATIAYTITSLASTDIDFILWDVTNMTNPCSAIQAASIAPVGCNYAVANATTGLTTTLPLPFAFSSAVTFTGSPRNYIILAANWNSAINGSYTLNWLGTPISPAGSNAIWTGGANPADTSFSCSTCWGSCTANPVCGIDAVLFPTNNGRQPTVSGTQSCRNLTINTGATLRILSGDTLIVCGNMSNHGTLICETGSTLIFTGATTQVLSGSLTGTNGIGNLVINKTAGSLTLADNIDLSGTFLTTNATSIFSINGKYLKIKGDFINYSASTTFTGIANSIVEFNGNFAQRFTNTLGTITLNRVVINKSAGNLYLTGGNSSMYIDSALTLIKGNISTRFSSNLEVFLKNASASAISSHSANSYIDGILRRGIYSGTPLVLPTSLDFPLGDTLATPGYELANITFTTGTIIGSILGTFKRWNSIPPVGPLAIEFLNSSYNAVNALDHGYWKFSKTSPVFNGNYNVTLYNTSYTNNYGGAYTIAMAGEATNPNLASSWALYGQCDSTSTASITRRKNINGAFTLSAILTIGSNQLHINTPTELSVGMPLSGTGIPAGSTITSILSPELITISNPATTTITGNITVGSTATQAASFNSYYCVVQSLSPYTSTPQIPLNITAFIEGYYLGSRTMQPVLLNQNVPNATATQTDTITVELYNPTTLALVGSAKGILMTDGTCSVQVPGTTGNYYIAIRHRNSIAIWSALPVALSQLTTNNYDFSSDPSSAFSNWLAEDFSDGVYALFTGDINQDEFIDPSDYVQYDYDNSQALCCDYHVTDLNGDGFIDTSDYPFFDLNNALGVMVIRP